MSSLNAYFRVRSLSKYVKTLSILPRALNYKLYQVAWKGGGVVEHSRTEKRRIFSASRLAAVAIVTAALGLCPLLQIPARDVAYTKHNWFHTCFAERGQQQTFHVASALLFTKINAAFYTVLNQ